ncbi:MAG: 3-phosphoshikimate 1-carboxyvinyltransferase [Paludibacteraceae bacterium]|nr:3-phosphoshikimate 1-carboxyvinyltransferase [Paludibacteraceae bacterium]MBO7234577.1 3-phosphoshikimate 1-carboxyvinyltransferase [Paludibacteraceae bacterium]
MITIHLPSSKSICNRVLLLNALSYSPYQINNLSDCDDTRVLLEVLDSDTNQFNIGTAGTAMRFLTAFLAKTYGEWHITGSERMLERPIKVLVDALNHLGAKIEYTGKEGFPPLHIFGSALQGGEYTIDGSISSQYISALMMVAPYMEKGLILHIEGQPVSEQYIRMTRSLMQYFGVKVEINGPHITIPPQEYTPQPITVENDWTAASYFYEYLAIKGNGQLFLPNLHKNSLQGDAQCATFFQSLGVNTSYKKEGVYITSHSHKSPRRYVRNLINQPDLAQTIAVTCCLKNIPFTLNGLQTLYIKETNRIAALINEMRKLGYILTSEQIGTLSWDGTRCLPDNCPTIETYNDHRMAMAFAPASLVYPNLQIKNHEVVSKSFPDFWTEYSKLC